MNLKSVIAELQMRSAEMKLPDLRRLIEELRPELDEVSPYVHFTDERYARNLVIRDPHFEVLVLCWRAGQRSPLHDHGSSICAVRTVQGTLSADNYRKTAAGHVRADYSEDFPPGSVLSIQTSEIHQVSNLQSSEDMVSLHFYLSPLDVYSTYSPFRSTPEPYRLGYTRVFTSGAGI